MMNDHHHHQEQQMGLGLARYQSAPSSYFATILSKNRGAEDSGQFFMNSGNFSGEVQIPRELTSNDYSSASSVIYQSHTSQDANCPMNSNLARQSSSPAGLLSTLNVENDHVSMRSMGSFGSTNSPNSDASFFDSMNGSKVSRLDDIGDISRGDVQFDEESRDHHDHLPWDDPEIVFDSLLDNKTTATNVKALHDQNPFGGTPPAAQLSHHLSLPKSCAELLSQDSVPCKIRAKRGCATHPRSIAERVRRTKISERMRKLQELVPNMEKQTNTADMLDLAVEYIKDLQTQVKTLSDAHAKCSCLARQKVPIQPLQH